MDARAALEALTTLHRPGTMSVTRYPKYQFPYAEKVRCCMVCPGDGWPCDTRRIIDLALEGEHK